jgi:hypothetical protein
MVAAGTAVNALAKIDIMRCCTGGMSLSYHFYLQEKNACV